jgi:hypothetical protein
MIGRETGREAMRESFGIEEHRENNEFFKMLSYPWMVLTSRSGLEKRRPGVGTTPVPMSRE